MDNINEYLKYKLEESSRYTPNDYDRSLIEKSGMENFIYAKLTSKKFRKWKVDELSEKQVRRAIEISLATDAPLKFRYPFGGYKLWRLPASPHIDWAEFFAVAYLLEYLAPIAAYYSPGIEIILASDEVIIERMDNIPKADTEIYFNEFKMLLSKFLEFTPQNISLDIIKIGDLYESKSELETEFEKNKEDFSKKYQELNLAEDDPKYKMSELNIKWAGAKDLSGLDDSHRREFIKQGPIFHDAYCSLSRRRSFNRGDDKIVLFTTPIPNALAVGTTKNSVSKFWTGVGVLQNRNRRGYTLKPYSDRVLSPTQFSELENSLVEHEVQLIDLPRLSSVLVSDKELGF